MRQSTSILKYLNVRELLQYALVPGLDFLEASEADTIWGFIHRNKSSGMIATRLLYFLKHREGSRREDDFCKFIACIKKASSHRGHKELAKIFEFKLTKDQWMLIHSLEEEAESPQPSPYTTPLNSPAPPHNIAIYSPEKPMPLISLQGQLMEEEFVDIDRQLWLSFSKGSYDDLEGMIGRVTDERGVFDADCQVVALYGFNL